MEKRFIYGLASEWYGVNNANKSANETKYAGSIVFIKNDTDKTKGDAIFAQGAYFEMSNTADVENIINSYLDEGKNIDIAVDQETEKLVISAISLASIDKLAEVDKTKLVEAQAVKDALTTPVNLTLTLDNNGVASFAETFKTLEGGDKTATATTAVLKQGDYISFTNDGGLKISVNKTGLVTDLKTDLNYSNGNVITVDNEKRTINHNEVAATTKTTGTAITPTSDAKTFDIKSYGFDKYGHISTETTTTVTLPDNAFENDNTTYTGENAINVAPPEEGSTQGKVTLKIDSTDKVLTQSASGLKTNLAIEYVSSTNKIRLTNGIDMISEFDASAFVKDSFLKNVEITTENESGVAGNYLKFTFETIDTDGTGDPVDSEKVIYVDIKDFYVKTTVSKDDDTYTSVAKTGDDYKVSNVLGTISRDNDSNAITVSKDGLATVADIKTVLKTIDSDLDAVKAVGADANEIAVVTGVTQVDGKITSVDSGLAATKAYVDSKAAAATTKVVESTDTESQKYLDITSTTDNTDKSTTYTVKVSGIDDAITTAINNLDSSVDVDTVTGGGSNEAHDGLIFEKIEETNGKLDASKTTVKYVDQSKLTNLATSKIKYTGVTNTDTISQAIEKMDAAWEWGTI